MEKMLALGIVLSAKDMFSPVLSKLNGGIGDVIKNTDAMAAKKIDLGQKLDKVTMSAYGLDKQIKEIDVEIGSLNSKKIKLAEQFKSGEISAEKFKAELDKIERKKSLLDSRKMRLSEELDKTTASAKKLGTELDKIDKAARFEKVGKALKDVSGKSSMAGTAMVGVSVASRGAAETVIQSFVDFEDAQTQLKNTLMKSDGSVSPFFKSISDEATKLGNALPGTTADFFKMASTLKSLGVEEKSIVGGALKSAAYLGAVLKIPYEEAAISTAKFKEAMGIADDELITFIDDIQRMSHMGVQVGEMSYAFSKIGATMKGLGMSGLNAARDVEPLIGMLIKAGFSGETVGTNLGNIIKQAVGFDGSKELDDLGIKLNFNDAKGNFKGTENMIKELEKLKAIKSDAARLAAVESVFGKGEAATMVNVLISKGADGLAEFNKQMKAQADINQRAAETSKTLGSMWEAMTGTVTNLYALIGGSLSPEMKSVTEWFGTAAAAITSFGEKHPVVTKFVGGAVVGLTIVTGVLGTLGIAVGALTFAMGALGITTMVTFGWIIAGVALVAGAIYLFSMDWAGAWEGVKIIASNAWSGIKSTISSAWEGIKSLFSWHPLAMIINNWGAIKTWFSNLWSGIKSTVSTAWDSFKPIFAWTPMGLIVNNWGAIKGFFSGLWSGVKSSVSSIWEGIKSLFSWHPLALIINNWTPITGFFTSIIAKIKQPFSELFGWIEGKFKTVSGLISDIGSFFGMEAPKPAPVAAKATAATPKPATAAVPMRKPAAVPAAKATAATPKPATIPARAPSNTSQPQRATGPIKPQIASVPPRKPSAPTNNVTVNINNPRFDSKEEAAATRKQIVKEVETAMKKMANDKKDRSYT